MILIVLIGAGFITIRQRSDQHEQDKRRGDSELPSSPSASALSARPPDTRRPAPAVNAALDALSPKLRKLVQEFESHARFLDSADGFDNDDLRQGRAKVSPLIDALSVDEITSMIDFYENPAGRPLSLNGFDLTGPLLFIALGKRDPKSAVDWIEKRFQSNLQAPDRAVKFTGPYPLLDAYDLGYIFRGWAIQDPDAALSGWSDVFERTIANEPRVPQSEAQELDGIVREAITVANSPDPILPSQ